MPPKLRDNNTAVAKVILLAMGNDILGDDGVALAVARQIRGESAEDPALNGVEIIESAEAGLAIMELLAGAERALILDCIATGKHAPGTLLEFTVDDFRRVVAPSPHYAGLPEVIEMAARLGIAFPGQLRVVAMEVENPWDVREEMSPSAVAAIPAFVARTRSVLRELLEN